MIIRTGDIIKHDNVEDKYYIYREHSEVYGTWSQIYVINNLVVEKLIKLEYLYELPPDDKYFNFGGNEFKTDIIIDVDVILNDIGNETMSKYKEKIKMEERSDKITKLDVGKRVILKPFNKEDEHEMVVIIDCVVEEARQSLRQDGPYGEASGGYIQVEKYIVEKDSGTRLVVPIDRLIKVRNTVGIVTLSEKIASKLYSMYNNDDDFNKWSEKIRTTEKYHEYVDEITKLLSEELR